MLSVCPACIPTWNIFECTLWCVLIVYGLRKVFTLTFFWLMHFPLSSNQNGKGCFPDVSSKMTHSLLRFCKILGNIKIFSISSIHLNFIGKGEAFHGILYWLKVIFLTWTMLQPPSSTFVWPEGVGWLTCCQKPDNWCRHLPHDPAKGGKSCLSQHLKQPQKKNFVRLPKHRVKRSPQAHHKQLDRERYPKLL